MNHSIGAVRAALVEEGMNAMKQHEFSGLSPRLAKRRALNYWYMNRSLLGLSMSQFFSQCRMCEDNGMTKITFYKAVA
jgi:Na+-transporting NADH:ubiquinone oxidoreductase subunit NqrF